MSEHDPGRRRFLLGSGALLGLGACRGPALIAGEAQRPQLLHGLQIGDVHADQALIWARADRTARLQVEWSTDPSFRQVQRVLGPEALEASDYTAKLLLTQLPVDRQLYLRVSFSDVSSPRLFSAPWLGQLRTAPSMPRDIRFLWSGDTVGQGYGISAAIGGMRIYEVMRNRHPDFFIHCGDTIYADNPVPESQPVPEQPGVMWHNLVTPEKSQVAQTLAELRGCYRYNLLDENVRRFNAQVPQLWQWDDHEIINNWSPAKDLTNDQRYHVKSPQLLAANAKRAFLEYAPMVCDADSERARIYRHIPYGPLLDVFIVDMQSYRGPNTPNQQQQQSADTVFMGRPQLQWLKQGLAASRAVWKVIAADMPLGLIVPDQVSPGDLRCEGIANTSGPPLGRELELAELLSFIKAQAIENCVWLTADVHYTAAHYYDPTLARFNDFSPFWEFVSGPLNAGSFGPNQPDDTFGLQVVYQKVSPVMNASPLAGYQFFGEVDIEAATRNLTVTLRDVADNALWSKTLEPKRT